MSCHSFFLMKDNLVIPSLYYPFFLMEVLNHAMSSLLFNERLQIVSYLLGKTCLLTNFLTPFGKTYLLTNFLTPLGKTYSFIITQIAFPIFLRRSSSKNCFPYFRETFFVKLPQIVFYLLGKTHLTNFWTPFAKTYLLTNFLTPFGKTYLLTNFLIPFGKAYLLTNFLTPFGKTRLLTNLLTPFGKTRLLTNFLTPFGKTAYWLIF